MRIANDGYIDFTDRSFVRLPGDSDEQLDPLPEREALAFLLSHAFRGARIIVRPLSEQNRRTLRRAIWADSVGGRMNLLDRVWREITEPIDRSRAEDSQLLQIVVYGDEWAYPVYLTDGTVQVNPRGGVPLGQVKKRKGTPRIDVRSA